MPSGLTGDPNELFADPSGAAGQAQQSQIAGGATPQAGPVQGLPGAAGGTTLPPTGIQQQLGSVGSAPPPPPSPQGQAGQGGMGSTSLEGMVNNLATNYGIQIPRGGLVDASGNMLITPDQVQDASGGAMGQGMASAKLGYISDAIARHQDEQQQEKARASVATGIGQVQQRGRGSLASLQMQAYRDMADLYANQEYEKADFSYFIQAEQQELARQQEAQTQEREEKTDMFGNILSGAGTGFTIGGPVGALIGGGIGAITSWF